MSFVWSFHSVLFHSVPFCFIPFRSVSFHPVPFCCTCTFSKFQHIEYKLNGAMGGPSSQNSASITTSSTLKYVYKIENQYTTEQCEQIGIWLIISVETVALAVEISNTNQCYFGTAQTFRHSCQLVTTNMYGAIFAEFTSCSLSRIKTVKPAYVQKMFSLQQHSRLTRPPSQLQKSSSLSQTQC